MALLLTTIIKKFGKETTIVLPGAPPPGIELCIEKSDLEAVNGGWELEQHPNEKDGSLILKLVRPAQKP